jgi:hypothetical protein
MVQLGPRRHGNGGIDGNPGNVESATCRFQKVLPGSNPTLSASLSYLESAIILTSGGAWVD